MRKMLLIVVQIQKYCGKPPKRYGVKAVLATPKKK
jgi:hypothetical protein